MYISAVKWLLLNNYYSQKNILVSCNTKIRLEMQGLKETSIDHIIQSHQRANQLDQNYIWPTAASL